MLNSYFKLGKSHEYMIRTKAAQVEKFTGLQRTVNIKITSFNTPSLPLKIKSVITHKAVVEYTCLHVQAAASLTSLGFRESLGFLCFWKCTRAIS